MIDTKKMIAGITLINNVPLVAMSSLVMNAVPCLAKPRRSPASSPTKLKMSYPAFVWRTKRAIMN